MSTLMKVTVNTRLDANFNTSISFEHIVSNEEDSEELGKSDLALMKAYFKAFE